MSFARTCIATRSDLRRDTKCRLRAIARTNGADRDLDYSWLVGDKAVDRVGAEVPALCELADRVVMIVGDAGSFKLHTRPPVRLSRASRTPPVPVPPALSGSPNILGIPNPYAFYILGHYAEQTLLLYSAVMTFVGREN